MTLTARCPAKLNLFLSVGPAEQSGYHRIRTVFQAVGLCDDLAVTVADADAFECDSPEVPEENTVTKAWRLAREFVGIPPLTVRLTKRIPARSGLGGGSSDAAGFLRLLVRLTRGAFTLENAREVANAVGADVPFFLVGGMARGERYGEALTPLPDVPTRWATIVMPDTVVSTGEAYARLDALSFPWREFPADPWALGNDFERVAPCVCLEAIGRLRACGAGGAGLTGSGAAVFGLFTARTAAEAAAERLADEGFARSWCVPTLSREESLWTS